MNPYHVSVRLSFDWFGMHLILVWAIRKLLIEIFLSDKRHILGLTNGREIFSFVFKKKNILAQSKIIYHLYSNGSFLYAKHVSVLKSYACSRYTTTTKTAYAGSNETLVYWTKFSCMHFQHLFTSFILYSLSFSIHLCYSMRLKMEIMKRIRLWSVNLDSMCVSMRDMIAIVKKGEKKDGHKRMGHKSQKCRKVICLIAGRIYDIWGTCVETEKTMQHAHSAQIWISFTLTSACDWSWKKLKWQFLFHIIISTSFHCHFWYGQCRSYFSRSFRILVRYFQPTKALTKSSAEKKCLEFVSFRSSTDGCACLNYDLRLLAPETLIRYTQQHEFTTLIHV